MSSSEDRHRGCFHAILRWTLRVVFLIVVLCAAAFAFVFRGALYNRFIQFPKEAKAWEEIRSQRVAVTLDDGWQDFAGVCHSHSYLSHDCDVPFEEILRVLKETGRQFICMSDHCDNGKADFSKPWEGVKDGVLFIPGYEMSYGFMPWGLPNETVLDCGKDEDALAQEIESLGGLLFFAHTEEPRRYDLPQLDGMEIYNIHTDFKDEKFSNLGPDLILNRNAYPDQAFRLLFDEQTAILENWDKQNQTRKIVGIAGNDCHQNNGVTGTYTEDGNLLIRDTSPRDIRTVKLNVVTRTLLRIFYGPLEPGRELFRYQIDPYERMVRYVSTHILAHELSRDAILESLKQGRVYVGFDAIADPTGFTYVAEEQGQIIVIGESMPFSTDVRLRAESPHQCRFVVKRNGLEVLQEEGTAFSWQPDVPGKYRVEAWLEILDQWTPWVYTNPIELL